MDASRQSFLVSAVICVLMAALFVARYLLAPYPVEAPFEGGMPLAAILTRFTVSYPWPAAVAATIIVVWTMMLIIQLTVKYAPAASRNYLPAQIFLICTIGIVVSNETLAALAVAWLLTLAMRQMVFSFHKGYGFSELFHAGLYLGVIPLLYAPAVVAVPVIAIAALVIYRRSVRETVVCAAGFLLPLPAAGFTYWALGYDTGFIRHELWRCATEYREPWALFPVSTFGVAAFVLIFALIGLLWALGHKKSIRKTQFKFMQHTALVLLAATISAAVPGTSAILMAIAAVPIAISVPFAFSGELAKASTAIYCLILTAVLTLGLLPVLGISPL